MNLRAFVDRGIGAAELGIGLIREGLETGLVFVPTQSAFRVDPYPYYRKFRERDPIHRSFIGPGWALTRHRDIVSILRDPRFSADDRNWSRYETMRGRGRRSGLPPSFFEQRASMLRRDPPEHTRLRNLVNKAFTPMSVERMRPRGQSIIDELLDPLSTTREFNLIADFASPLTLKMIAEMLGVPTDDLARFRQWSDDAVLGIGASSREQMLRASKAMHELSDYLEMIAEERSHDPRPDLLSALVAVERSGDRLSREELASMAVLILVAGNETTTNLIANGILALLANPDQLALLRREPKYIPNAVDELLRFDAPVQMTSRFALEDLEYEGHSFRRGEQILLLLGAANRDPEVFPDPDRLDVTRESINHLSFSSGVHFCLGAQLAHLEATLAFQALLARFPKLELATDHIEWRRNLTIRGPVELPLRF